MAEAIQRWASKGEHAAHAVYLGSVASELKADNPRFDRQRFMQACGFEGE